MINLNWLKKHLPNDCVIFDIGCANIEHGEMVEFRNTFSTAKIYAFECNPYWLKSNIVSSLKYGIFYFHVAMDGVNGVKRFFQSLTQNNTPHHWSGSFYKDIYTESNKVYDTTGIEIPTIRYDTFCKTFGVIPDFIHIDVEGSEYQILQNLDKYKPKFIWAELVGFDSYDCGITREQFDTLLDNQGYKFLGTDNEKHNGLYCLKELEVEEYNHDL
jgi:FkbM family methyltransferase